MNQVCDISDKTLVTSKRQDGQVQESHSPQPDPQEPQGRYQEAIHQEAHEHEG